jgi:hypothetical protein
MIDVMYLKAMFSSLVVGKLQWFSRAAFGQAVEKLLSHVRLS